MFARSSCKMVIDTLSCPLLSRVSGNTAGAIAEHQPIDPRALCGKGRAALVIPMLPLVHWQRPQRLAVINQNNCPESSGKKCFIVV